VSDHNPVAEDMKNLPFGEAEPGATGLELLLSLALRWGEDHRPAARTRRWPASPASRCGCWAMPSARWRRALGGWSKAAWPMSASSTRRSGRCSHTNSLCSQGKHTPFAFEATGMALPGRVRATLVAGTVAYERR
jgi:dihydroorotase